MTEPNAASREARAREIAAQVFDARARKASHPEAITLERHHAKRIRAGEGDDYDVVQDVLLALAYEAASQPREDDDDLDTTEARLDMVRAALQMIVSSPENAVPLAKAGLDMIELNAAERAEMRGDTIHDTAPTDQAQGGGDERLRAAFAAGFEAGEDLESHHSRGLSTDPHVDTEDEAWAKFIARNGAGQ